MIASDSTRSTNGTDRQHPDISQPPSDQLAGKDRATLAAVVVNFRTPELTVACLRSFASQRRDGDTAVVVDNASGDGSDAVIADAIEGEGWQQWCRLILSEVNGGFAAGNNLGIRTLDADGYLLINSDAELLDGALDVLRAAWRQDPLVGLIGPSFETEPCSYAPAAFRDVHPISELLRSARTGIITRPLRRYDLQLSDGSESSPDWIGFGCVLIRREVVEEIGLLDDGYFMYFEDLDYCRRARAAGWRIACSRQARAVHHSGQSSDASVTDDSLSRLPRYYYEARSRHFAKHYGLLGLWLANGAWLLGRSISWSRELLGNKPPHLRRHEARDIWINAFRPLCRSSAQSPQPAGGS